MMNASMEPKGAALPQTDCLMVAAATPLTDDFRPDIRLLTEHVAMLMRSGCDGVALFGTTGEGSEFAVEDRMQAVDGVIAGGIPPARLIVSIGALAIPDVVRLAHHALDRGVDSLLLMPPCVYRSGITDEGTYKFYATVIDRVARHDLRLCLYHFPGICGVPLTPTVIRRLDQNYRGIISGIKDSGGDLDYTEALIRRFSHLSIFTGSETHLPQALAAGARGTICGLGNAMPRLMRALFDGTSAFERRKFLPALISADMILSRGPFPASVKAILAAANGTPAWNRVLPPMSEVPMPDRQWMLGDFIAWETKLPPALRTFFKGEDEAKSRVVAIRRI